MTPKQGALENNVGKRVSKRENAVNQHFLLFPLFSTLPKPNINFSFTFILSSTNAFNLDQSFGKELIM